MRNLLISLILIVWFLLGFAYCKFSDTCCNTDTEKKESVKSEQVVPALETPVKEVKAPLEPLTYNWSDSTAFTNEGWAKYKQDILSSLKENQILEITGHYSAEEENNTSFENLGLARAHAARSLFTDLPDDRFRLLSKLVDSENLDKSNPFVSTEFNNRINTDKIKEIDQKTIIYFPYNSTNKLNDKEVESYLDDVADNLKNNSKKVRLTGHTDSIGDESSNITLGKKRADIIKQYLVSKGLTANRIISISKGESSPIDSNKTKSGRANNRRTELEIIN